MENKSLPISIGTLATRFDEAYYSSFTVLCTVHFVKQISLFFKF
jgi:hypothetical protein